MQNYYKLIGTIAAATALVAGNASAEIEYTLHTGYSNEYLFRGLDAGDDLIEAGFDVKSEWNGLGLSAGAWYGTFTQSSAVAPAGQNTLDELDVYGAVSKDLGFATVSLGYIYYMQDNNNVVPEDSQEIYFSVAKEFFGLNTTLTYFWEIEDAGSGTGGYLEAKVDKSFELSQCLTLNTSGTLGYLVEESEFAQFTAKVSLDWAFTGTAKLSPYIAASWGLTNDARSNSYVNVGEEFVVGTMLSVSF